MFLDACLPWLPRRGLGGARVAFVPEGLGDKGDAGKRLIAIGSLCIFRCKLEQCEKTDDARVGELDLIRSSRSKETSLSFENVLEFLVE